MTRRQLFATPLGLYAAGSAAVRAGFAEADITPELGMEEPGGYSKRYHRSLHDPCKARVAVFDDGAKSVALVGIDALVTPRIVTVKAREAIAARTGLKPEAILIGASHSHSSGPVGMVLPGEYDFTSDPLIRKLAYELSSGADAKYLDFLTRQIVEAVVKAWASRRALLLGAGVGHEDKAAFNRRHRMKNGLTYTHPRQGNPEMLDYAGPIDPEVGVIGAWDEKGRLAGCIVNYACHATTSPGGISANWIYYMEKVIRGSLAEDAVVVFLQGCSGDITQVDNKSPYAMPSGDEQARLVGGRVGAEAVKTLLSMQRGQLTPVDYAVENVRIARRAPAAARVAEARQVVAQDAKAVGATRWTFAKELLMADALARHEPAVLAEFQAIQLGPALFVSNPGETFVEIGLALKKRSRFKMTFPVELANGCVGYVATEEGLGPQGGGYETRLTSYTNLEPKAAATFVNAGVRLSQRFTPGALPVGSPAPKFTGPWDYGSVPAEVK